MQREIVRMQSTVGELVMESVRLAIESFHGEGCRKKIPIRRNSFRWKPFRRYCKLRGGDICEESKKKKRVNYVQVILKNKYTLREKVTDYKLSDSLGIRENTTTIDFNRLALIIIILIFHNNGTKTLVRRGVEKLVECYR